MSKTKKKIICTICSREIKKKKEKLGYTDDGLIVCELCLKKYHIEEGMQLEKKEAKFITKKCKICGKKINKGDMIVFDDDATMVAHFKCVEKEIKHG